MKLSAVSLLSSALFCVHASAQDHFDQHNFQAVVDPVPKVPEMDTMGLRPPPKDQAKQITIDELNLNPEQRAELEKIIQKSKIGSGKATKPPKPHAYQDIFPSLSHRMPDGSEAPRRAKYREKKRHSRPNAKDKETGQIVPKGEDKALKAGLPGIVVAELDPDWVYDHGVGSSSHGESDDPLAPVLAMGETLCKRLAFAIHRDTDIEPNSVHWLKARHACLFQVLMDENADDVVEWLLDQPNVLIVEGNSPMDTLDNARWV